MQLITLKEVCKLCNVSHETIRNWRKVGIFPKPKQAVIRGKLLWDINVINDWVKEKENVKRS